MISTIKSSYNQTACKYLPHWNKIDSIHLHSRMRMHSAFNLHTPHNWIRCANRQFSTLIYSMLFMAPAGLLHALGLPNIYYFCHLWSATITTIAHDHDQPSSDDLEKSQKKYKQKNAHQTLMTSERWTCFPNLCRYFDDQKLYDKKESVKLGLSRHFTVQCVYGRQP